MFFFSTMHYFITETTQLVLEIMSHRNGSYIYFMSIFVNSLLERSSQPLLILFTNYYKPQFNIIIYASRKHEILIYKINFRKQVKKYIYIFIYVYDTSAKFHSKDTNAERINVCCSHNMIITHSYKFVKLSVDRGSVKLL